MNWLDPSGTAINPAVLQGLSGTVAPVSQMQTTSPTQPFTWGEGGRRVTPEQLAYDREIAQGMLQSDYSPVVHWTQGLGRLADGLLGGLKMRQVNKQADAQTAYSDQIAQSLLGEGGGKAAAAAMVDPYASKQVQTLAGKVWDRANPKSVNNDSAADWAFYQKNLSPEQFEQWKANRIYDPPRVVIDPGTGQPMMVGGYQPKPAAPNVPTVSDQAGYDAIPSGQQFMDPEGNIRVKP